MIDSHVAITVGAEEYIEAVDQLSESNASPMTRQPLQFQGNSQSDSMQYVTCPRIPLKTDLASIDSGTILLHYIMPNKKLD